MKPYDLNKSLDTPRSSKKDEDNSLTQKAAANIVRAQIDNIYAKQDNESIPLESTNQDYLKKYHSAWQTYYQKYYEGYYTEHVKKQVAKLTSKQKESRSDEQIMEDLKNDLFSKIKKKSKKIRRSRHFIPILAGFIAILILGVLQYNQIIIANVVSFISPGDISPQNIIIDPNTDVKVDSAPKLIIPKINIDVPVVYDIGNDYDSQMEGMKNGVAHFSIPGANSHPGQIGNTVISGHSSNDLFDTGDYKFIFAQLEKLVIGDTIYAHYDSIRYTYSVTKIETVNPTDVAKLASYSKKPLLTLVTCTPLGTSRFRLLVTAEQISPNPDNADPSPISTSTESSDSIPGETKTLIEKLLNF